MRLPGLPSVNTSRVSSFNSNTDIFQVKKEKKKRRKKCCDSLFCQPILYSNIFAEKSMDKFVSTLF